MDGSRPLPINPVVWALIIVKEVGYNLLVSLVCMPRSTPAPSPLTILNLGILPLNHASEPSYRPIGPLNNVLALCNLFTFYSRASNPTCNDHFGHHFQSQGGSIWAEYETKTGPPLRA